MNRQMRRANERSEKRQEERLDQLSRAQRNPRPKTRTSSSKGGRKSSARQSYQQVAQARASRQMPNWLMGTLALVSLLFVVLPQGLPPAETINNTPPLYYASHALAFAIFAYFLTTWLLRRGTANALLITAFMVLPLACGVEIGKVMQLNQQLWRSAIFIPLALVGGAGGLWLAHAVEKARATLRTSA